MDVDARHDHYWDKEKGGEGDSELYPEMRGAIYCGGVNNVQFYLNKNSALGSEMK